MRTVKLSRWLQAVARLGSTAVCAYPSLLLAHPGHYHPEETDEFDSLRATFFHSHGDMDYLIAAITITSIATAYFSARPILKISALVAGLGSLALLPIL
jgi:hypothetical protein